MTTICTGWHPAGWEQYAHRFIDSFAQYWPPHVNIVCYTEEHVPIPVGVQRSVFECRGLKDFIARNEKNLARCGRARLPGWTDKDRRRGYTFRFDAVKFCKQCFIPEHAASLLPDGEILAWFDSDVVTFDHVPKGFIEKQLGDADLCYLGRGHYHSEIGFWATRLNGRTRWFLERFADIYRSDDVFALKEWHSAFVFDHVRKEFESYAKGGTAKNLTPNGRGHVWFLSELGKYTDHCKGDKRKKLGKSPERKRAS